MSEKNLSDMREDKLDARLNELAAAGDWDGVLRELDHYDENNERRHAEHRDGRELKKLEGELCRSRTYGYAEFRKLSKPEYWVEIIFSENPEDLYQLVEDASVSMALRHLTARQKRILLRTVVHGETPQDLAEELGCSARNITKQRQRALEKIRLRVTGRENIST